MVRAKRAVPARKRHKKVLRRTKGYYGARGRLYKAAHEAMLHALTYAYHGRRLRKRDMRRLWIVRINAAARQHGLSYSRFMHGLQQAGITIDRKMLADLAVRDSDGFAQVAALARDAIPAAA